MTMHHTPAPWRFHDGMIQCQSNWSDVTGDHFDWSFPRVLAEVADDWDQVVNGNVMAAAPALLAALKALHACHRGFSGSDDWTMLDDEARAAAEAAIAAAEGESVA